MELNGGTIMGLPYPRRVGAEGPEGHGTGSDTPRGFYYFFGYPWSLPYPRHPRHPPVAGIIAVMKKTDEYPKINIYQIRRDYSIPTGHGTITLDGQPVRLAWVAEYLGGIRPYFVCPQCSHRRHHLYNRDNIWACRVCHKLIHRSTIERPVPRAIRRADKLGPVGPKPKWKRRLNHARLTAKREVAFRKAALALLQHKF